MGQPCALSVVSMCSATADAAVRQEQFSGVKSLVLCIGFGLDQFM